MGQPTRIALRVDASAAMGTGHLKRCLSLAEALSEAGAEVRFIVRRLDAVAERVLAASQQPVDWLASPASSPAPLPSPAGGPPHAGWAGVRGDQDARDTALALRDWQPQWVVIDHYAFDAGWHQAVRAALGCRLAVIDDLADRPLDADALIDHNWSASHADKYAGRLLRAPRWFCGPRHALLAPAYRDAPRHAARDTVRSVGIFLGGTDPGGASALALTACRAGGFEGPVEVVSTSANPQLSSLAQACAQDANATLTVDAPDLAAFFTRHDLQVGAGGGATWERCCIGAPTIGLVLAGNQAVVVPPLERQGVLRAARLEGFSADPAVPLLQDAVRELLADADGRRTLGQRAAALVDGRGAQRVALGLVADTLQLRPATPDDDRMLHRWRNDPAVRAVSGVQDPIDFEGHRRWLARTLADPARSLFVAQVGDVPVGSIRFDRLASGHLEVSLYLDPQLQGLGLGRRMLLAGERAMQAARPGGLTVEAQVLPGNTVSQALFEACGYQGGPLHYQKHVGTPPEPRA